MMKSKVIHVVYECIPGEFRGGVQKVAFELALAQNKIGLDVEIWSLYKTEPKEDVDCNGVKIRYFKAKYLFGVARSINLIRELIIMKEMISIIHSHNTFHWLNIQLGKFSRYYSIPIFYHPHGALDNNLFNDFKFKSLKKRIYIKFFEAMNLKKAAGIFALTLEEKEQLMKLGLENNIHVLNNGINIPKGLPKKCESRKSLKVNLKKNIILYVGRIVAKKGLHIYLNALKEVISNSPDTIFIIVGDYNQDLEYTDLLKLKINNLDLKDNVIWAGFLNEKNKPLYFVAADIFIHASYSEGMAMSVLEAMSYSKPCLVTKGCYMQDAAIENSLIECEQDELELAKNTLNILNDKELKNQLIVNSKNYIIKNHNWIVIAHQTRSIYKL